MTENKNPVTVGRTVHYCEATGAAPLAATVAKIEDEKTSRVTLFIFNPKWKSPGPKNGVPYSETPKVGCWSWPPR